MKIVLSKMQDTSNKSMLTAVQYPNNIGYLSQVCQNAGYDVEMWDFCIEPFTEQYIIEKLKQSKPDVLGVSCVTAAISFGHELCTVAKRFDPNIFTMVGGVHVSVLPIKTMDEFPSFDLGIIAEAEETILDICAALEKHRSPTDIPGCVYRDNGTIKLSPLTEFPDVNEIPYPNRDLLPMELYTRKHSGRGVSRKVWNVIEIDSSRGCPFGCTFCNVEKTHGRKVRFRNSEHVLGEIAECVKKFDTNFVLFNDSTFTIRKDRVVEIVKQLPKMGIKAYAVNAHVNTVDADLLDTLSKTGCYKIMFGVESGSDRVLKTIRKNTTSKRIRTIFRLAKKAGIPQVEGTFILGADPHETEQDMQDTEKLIRQIRPDILAVGIITPFPGTAQFNELQRLGYLGNLSWDQYQIFTETPPPWRIVNYSAEELLARRNKMLKSYIWTPRYIFSQLLKIRSLSEFKYYATLARSFHKIVVKNVA